MGRLNLHRRPAWVGEEGEYDPSYWEKVEGKTALPYFALGSGQMSNESLATWGKGEEGISVQRLFVLG